MRNEISIKFKMCLSVLFAPVVVLAFAGQFALAQTSSFTYQGKLADSGVAANATYDITFNLYDTAAGGGTQIGLDVVRDNVVVSDGGFTVDLDFGAAAFANGGSRFLQIEVRPGTSVGTFTTLVPRQPLTSSPYAVKAASASVADSLSPTCVSCVTDANIDTVSAGKVSGVLSFFQGGTGIGGPTFPPAGGFLRSNGAGWEISGVTAAEIPNNLGSYIQNSTTTQATSNFNVSGTGTANIFSATTQFNIGGNRVLSVAGTSNVFAGVGAGQSNTGFGNTFVGRNAGLSNATGVSNSFFGNGAGQTNSTGSFNAFFGGGTGFANTGNENSFYGYASGSNNSTGEANSFFGRDSGNANTGGGSNSFFGYNSGRLNTLGNSNAFLGVAAGDANTSGSNNTIIGARADVATDNLNFATAIGADAIASTSNSVVLGRAIDTVRVPGTMVVTGAATFVGTPMANIFNATTQYNIGGNRVLSVAGNQNVFAGVGAGQSNTTGGFNAFFGSGAGFTNAGGDENSFFGYTSGRNNSSGGANSFFGKNAGFNNTAGGSNSFVGRGSGYLNTLGNWNTFVGDEAGDTNTTGNNNTVIGMGADLSTNNLNYATAIGSGAVATSSNTMVLGRNLDTVQVPGDLNVAGSITGTFNGTIATADNALNLGGVPANQYVVTTDPRMADARNPLPNSSNYIQNIPGIGTQSANFNIDGGGSANIFNATTQYNIGGNRILANPGTENLFAGINTGQGNTIGISNSFFGYQAGGGNTTGDLNSFFGGYAGFFNNTGDFNSFFGNYAGQTNSTGGFNSFFGINAGDSNTTGSENTIIGRSADVGAGNLTNATAIGANALVSQSNSLVLGNGANVGIGTSAPGFRLDVVGRSRFKQNAGDTGTTNTAGFWLFQNTPNVERAFVGMENDDSVGFFGNNGGGWGLAMNTQTGTTSIRTLAIVGVTSLCRNGQNEVSFCSSSLKYKTNISEFSSGLSVVNRLRPISFDWKDGGMKDVGFGAEDIAKIDPRFVTYNAKGEVEGVKYDRLSVAFVNAFKEQQTEISGQRSVISDQQQQIDDLKVQVEILKAVVCSERPTLEVCKPKEK
ncbi:MAG: tail fiber domain-containing protein [Pyrinomonadaceae bacterium]